MTRDNQNRQAARGPAGPILDMEWVSIHEVGPRDGFQSLENVVPTDRKLQVVDGLVAAGFDNIELTAFVSPQAVPQMRDASEVTARTLEKHGERRFCALVPNLKGAQIAHAAGLRRLNFVLSVSKVHNMANVGMDQSRSWDEFVKIRDGHPDTELRLNLATVFSAPVGDRVAVEDVMQFIDRARGIGITEVSVADTFGTAHPAHVRDVLSRLMSEFPDVVFLAHFHDTFGMAMLNCFVAAQLGCQHFETSVAGLGGCPFAPGAGGNLATEDLINMFESQEVATGIDLVALLQTAGLVKQYLEPHPMGRLVNCSDEAIEHLRQ